MRSGINIKYARNQEGAEKNVSLSAERKTNQLVSEDFRCTRYGDIDLYFSDTYANYLAWVKNYVYYSLIDNGKVITEDELIAMAKEMIDMKADTEKVK